MHNYCMLKSEQLKEKKKDSCRLVTKKGLGGLLLRLFSLLIIFMFLVVISIIGLVEFISVYFLSQKRHDKVLKANYVMVFPPQLLM